MRILLALLAVLLFVPTAARAGDEQDPDDESDDPSGWAGVYLDELEHGGGRLERSRQAGAGATTLNWTVPGAFFGFGTMAVGFSGDKRLGGAFHVAYLASALGSNLLARHALSLAGGDPKVELASPIVFGTLQVVGGLLWIEGAGNYVAGTSFFGTTSDVNIEAAVTMMLLGGMTGIIGYCGMLADTQLMVKRASQRRRGFADPRRRDDLERFGRRFSERPRLRLTGLGAAPRGRGAQVGLAFAW